MKFLIDECLSTSLAATLEESGLDVVHVNERGLAGFDDKAILQSALNEDRVLISADSDFGELLVLAGATKPSVIILKRTLYTVDSQIDAIVDVLDQIPNELDAGALVIVSDRRIRVRSLQAE